MSTQLIDNNIDKNVDEVIYDCIKLDSQKVFSFLLEQVQVKQGHLLMF